MTSFQDLFEASDQHWVIFKNKKCSGQTNSQLNKMSVLLASVCEKNGVVTASFGIDQLTGGDFHGRINRRSAREVTPSPR